MYRQMVRIRLFEEQVNELYTRALMPGLAHLYIGEEAVAVGICEALHRDDYITSTHRGHGHCLAKGASPDRMFAELLGKEAGYCKGKGGSMHIADPATGNLGANAIVGGSVGIATGAAFSAKRLGNGRVAVCFFGEGALGQGLLYEVMNMAQLWKLPVIYVCENKSTTSTRISPRPRPGTILGARCRVRDCRRRRSTARTCAQSMQSRRAWSKRARSGEGPAFLQCRYLPLQRASRGRHQPRILPLQAGRAALEDRARSDQAACRLADRAEARRCGGARSDCSRRSKLRWKPR